MKEIHNEEIWFEYSYYSQNLLAQYGWIEAKISFSWSDQKSRFIQINDAKNKAISTHLDPKSLGDKR